MGSSFCEPNQATSSPCKMNLEWDTKIMPIMGGSGNVSSDEISTIKVLDRSEYDALGPNRPTNTLYLIRG